MDVFLPLLKEIWNKIPMQIILIQTSHEKLTYEWEKKNFVGSLDENASVFVAQVLGMTNV